MSLVSEIDDRTVAEQMRDLGVPIERPNRKRLTDVKWIHRTALRRAPMVTIGKRMLYLNAVGVPLLRAEEQKYSFGVANFEGQKVLLLRPDDNGRKLTLMKRGGAQVCGSALCPQLRDAGLNARYYVLRKAIGGWMGVPHADQD